MVPHRCLRRIAEEDGSSFPPVPVPTYRFKNMKRYIDGFEKAFYDRLLSIMLIGQIVSFQLIGKTIQRLAP